MPKDAVSPFTPGTPASVDLFVGREKEIEELRRTVRTAISGRLQVSFLTGERGIGKSSLSAFLSRLCEREFRVLPIHIFLGGVATREEVVRRILDELVKQSIDKPWYERVGKTLAKHVRKVGLFGISVEFDPPKGELSAAVANFADLLSRIVAELEGDRAGLLLILDDINGLAGSAEFANWIKTLVDQVGVRGSALPVSLLFVGLPERREELIAQQPSLARVFQLLDVRPWSGDETKEFFRNAFGRAGIAVEDRAAALFERYSGGLPVIAHEIGDAAFRLDEDAKIAEDEAAQAVMAAAEIVGRKHLQPQVMKALRSSKYRRILTHFAKRELPDVHFTRTELLNASNSDDKKVLDNFLRRMRDLGVISQDEDAGPGSYKFNQAIHLVYFWMQQPSKSAS